MNATLLETLNDEYPIRPLKYGANCTTVLNENDSIVLKIAHRNFEGKLRDQYIWLKRNRGGPYPEVLGEGYVDGHYYFEMPFYYEHSPFFDFIHRQNTKDSFKILKNALFLYDKKKNVSSFFNLREYIEKKIFKKLTFLNLEIFKNKYLIINRKSYLNLNFIIDKILNNPRALYDLSNYSECEIHGDLTIENMLVRDNSLLILDPNNENIISSPVIDYAKVYQSLHSGYEFLCTHKKIYCVDNQINFNEITSKKYSELFNLVESHLKSRLPEGEFRTILFHEAVHFTRLLPYRAEMNPLTWPIYYAVAVRLFNQFLNQYEQVES